MAKFYVHRSNLATVTEVTEIEASSAQEARELVNDGEGKFLGVTVGDYYTSSEEEMEVLETGPHNLPSPFYPAEATV